MVSQGEGPADKLVQWKHRVKVADPDDSSWNPLLAELSRLSQTAEGATNGGDHEPSSVTALEVRNRVLEVPRQARIVDAVRVLRFD